MKVQIYKKHMEIRDGVNMNGKVRSNELKTK